MALRGLHNPALHADIVLWESQEQAAEAATILAQYADVSAFRHHTNQVDSLAHYMAEAMPEPEAGAHGCEIGRFKRRSGVTEAALQQAHQRMIK